MNDWSNAMGFNRNRRLGWLARARRPLSVWMLACGVAGGVWAEEWPERDAYAEMVRADRAREAGQVTEAVRLYHEAIRLFERLRRERPNYKPAVLEYRLEYCRRRVQELLERGVNVSSAASKETDRLGQLQEAVRQLTEERQALSAERNQLKAERDELANQARRWEQDARTAQQARDEATRRVQELERRVRELESSGQSEKLQRRLQQVEGERDQLRAQVQEISDALKQARAGEAEARRALQAREDECAQLRQQLDAHRTAVRLAEARAESLAAQLHLATERWTAAQQTPARSAEPAGTGRAAEDLERALRERDQLAAQVEQLQAKLAALESERIDDRAKLRELGRALKEAMPSREELQRTSQELAKVKEERDGLAEENAELKRQLSVAGGKPMGEPADLGSVAERDAQAAAERIRRLEAQCQALAAKLELRDREARDAQEQLAVIRRELARVQSERDRAQLELARRGQVVISTAPVLVATNAPSVAANTVTEPALTSSGPATVEVPSLEAAEVALASNQVDRAVELFGRFLDTDPTNTRALLGYARASLMQGRVQTARAAAERLVALSPTSAPAQHLLGLIEARENNRRAAARAFQRAAELDPENPMYHRDLAIAWYKLGRIEDAIAEYRRVIELLPNDGPAHFNLAALLMATRNPPVEEARALYLKARELGEAPDPNLQQRLGLSQP